MKGANDWKGLVYGLDQLKNIDDSMLMTYVCTNNTVQNVLNLKDNTMDFAGNYAIDITDITLHEPHVVLEYNGRDTCNTVHLIDKYINRLKPEGLYESYKILLDFILVGVELEIRGLPMNMDVCIDLYETVGNEIKKLTKSICDTPIVSKFTKSRHYEAVYQKNLDTPSKIYHVDTFPKEEFNPNSDLQVSDLIHEFMELEVLDTTPTGLPAMGVDSLIKLKHNVKKEIEICKKSGKK
jgi:DNA polymerase I-like protein with 3'-5' exonuclease and polymerase domains